MLNKVQEKELRRGVYILLALEQYCLNGDAYVWKDEVYSICKKENPKLSFAEFSEDYAYLLRENLLCLEGRRVYLRDTLRYENSAAENLSKIIKTNTLKSPNVPDVVVVGTTPLCNEQLEAVRMALSHRLSIVLGGAGTGKSTLIRAIAQHNGDVLGSVLCAPTGKAARNLTERTGMIARTVHSALGVIPDADFLAPVHWDSVSLVVVDEASMMSLGMLAGILDRVRYNCHIVLLGDPNQLLSVGSGNVLPDLLALGIPYIRLEENHRQEKGAEALLSNVVGFSNLRNGSDLTFDDSFCLCHMSESSARQALIDEAVRRYSAGEMVQVLSPYNTATELSVAKLNQAIRERLNPDVPGKKCLKGRFRDGDKVIITNNDRDRNCSNGDIGVLRIISDNEKKPLFYVESPDGRRPSWDHIMDLQNIALAYALTVHKSQGSEWDTVLMALTDSFNNMMYRNLIYTAVSRARRKVILYGSKTALSTAIQRPSRERRSQLVTKCRVGAQASA